MRLKRMEIWGRVTHHTCGDVIEVWDEKKGAEFSQYGLSSTQPHVFPVPSKRWSSTYELVQWMGKALQGFLSFSLQRKRELCTIEPSARVKLYRFSPRLGAIFGFSNKLPQPAVPRTNHINLLAPFTAVALVNSQAAPNLAHNQSQCAAFGSCSLQVGDDGVIEGCGDLLTYPLRLPSTDLSQLKFQLISLSAFGIPICVDPLDIFLSLQYSC